MTSYLVVILFIFSLHQSHQMSIPHLNATGCYKLKDLNQVRVFITISSIMASTTHHGIVTRHLELNWIGGQSLPGDSVGLYDVDPNIKPEAKPLASIDPTEYPGGYFQSKIAVPVDFFNLTSLMRDPCLGYWAAYKHTNGSIVSSSCLETHPFWMQKNSFYLYNLSLPEIMIPGSHDSGSYYFHREIAPISKYKYAQEEPIFNQLVYGIRYFDLRVGYYKKTKDKYYINHNFLRTQHSVRSVLHQVHEFIHATKEIVILDFHNFPKGFKNAAIHQDLMEMIVRKFKSYLIPYKEDYLYAKFSNLWEEDKRVLVSYDSPVRETLFPDLLWPKIPRAWGNKQYPNDLKLYFEDVYKKPTPEGLWASMAELTPNARTIVLHPETGLRVFAEEINRNVTHWFRDLYWRKANIVATDYFMGNDIIHVAINTNRIKGSCPRHVWKR